MFCKNTECTEILKGKLTYLVSKKNFNIIGLGKRILVSLVDNNIVKNIADVFNLSFDDLIRLDGFGKKLTTNLINEVNLRKKIAFDRFINSLGVRHVGENISKNL